MSRWRIAVLAGLVVTPILFLVGVGFYHLFEHGWSFYVGWGFFACLSIAYFLAAYWQRKRQLLRGTDFEPELHWTDRDREAWKLVEQRAKDAATVPSEQLTEVHFYTQTTEEMALQLARFYRPHATDPYGTLTVPEILAVAELAAQDLTELVQQYLPGGHLMSVNDWKRARKLTEWYEPANNVYWLIATVFAPETALRWAATKLGLNPQLKRLQQNLLLWFYTGYVHELGKYLIELHSGRLRVGAKRYRELLARHRAPEADKETRRQGDKETEGPPAGPEEVSAPRVALTVFGQVKAGKSSLINALLGERRAQTDVLPATNEITRYQLHPGEVPSMLELLDTVGYAHTGPRADQVRATEQAARESDLLILVLHATNPGRQADRDMLDRLKAHFAERSELRMPPLLAVVTHIDLLTPAMEWKPPYDWQDGIRPKEVTIRKAAAAVREQFGESLVDIVPVCVAPGKEFGVQEDLLPTLARRLDQAHAVALLRCLWAEANARKVRKVLDQLLAAGKQAFRVILEQARK